MLFSNIIVIKDKHFVRLPIQRKNISSFVFALNQKQLLLLF